MLTLWRNVGERILIGDDIVVTMLANQNNEFARVQIEAPLILEDNPRTARIFLNEPYRLTDSIVIRVIEVERAGARFGIEAPRDVSIDREEIRAMKRKRNEETK